MPGAAYLRATRFTSNVADDELFVVRPINLTGLRLACIKTARQTRGNLRTCAAGIGRIVGNKALRCQPLRPLSVLFRAKGPGRPMLGFTQLWLVTYTARLRVPRPVARPKSDCAK